MIFIGFRIFILEFENLFDIFLNKIFLILLTFLLWTFSITLDIWKQYISDINNSAKKIIKVIIYFPCLIMSTVIIFPQKIFINICGIIFTLIYNRNFTDFMGQLYENFRRII